MSNTQTHDPPRPASHTPRLDSEPPLWGPITLWAAVAWLATITAWDVFWVRKVPHNVLEQYTAYGLQWYRPEYDLPIYVAGVLGALAAGTVSAWVWRRLWFGAADPVSRHRLQRHFGANAACMGGCVLLAAFAPSQPAVVGLSALLAGGCGAVLWWRAVVARRADRRAVHEPCDPQRLSAQGMSAQGTEEKAPTQARNVTSRSSPVKRNSASEQRHSKPATSSRGDLADRPRPSGGSQIVPARWAQFTWLFSVSLLVASLVAIWDITELATAAWNNDQFMHWNYYVMGPLLAFRHGAALGTDFYTQYGVGWPLTYWMLCQFFTLDYDLLLQAAVLWACIYFVGLFLFLTSLLKQPAWAMLGLLLALYLQMFSGTDVPIWCYPSSTILRNPFDIFLFWTCWTHARTFNARHGGLIGLILGLCVLFGTDTGLYSMCAVGWYMLLATRYRTAGQQLFTVHFALCLVGPFIATLVAGLAWASRGTCATASFWTGYLEALMFYGGGFGARPMRLGLQRTPEFLLFMAIVLTYTYYMARAQARFWADRLTARDLVYSTIAVFGLGSLLLFIGRSHPHNLYHPIVPWCILIIASMADFTRHLAWSAPKWKTSRWAWPWVADGVMLLCLAFNPCVWNYPSFVTAWCGALRTTRATVDRARLPAPDSLVPDYVRALAPHARHFRELSQGGTVSLAVVQDNETPFLVAADLAPALRYSPLQLIHQHQITLIEQQLKDHPPDIVAYWPEAKPEMHSVWMPLLSKYYNPVRRDGPWIILQPTPTVPAPSASRVK